MKIVFCSEPFSPATADSMYECEVRAAVAVGFDYELVNFEALTEEGRPSAAVKRVRSADTLEVAIYRGWMLTPEQYGALYEALREKNLLLINDPQQYKHCHYMPESYAVIESETPKTVFLPFDESFNFDQVMQMLAAFGDGPVVLKDYVKSRKHEWAEACFIPSASNRTEVERVMNRFLELQGNHVNGGFVFREYVEFEPLAVHSKSGMPLTKEYRLFYLDGILLQAQEYWEEGDYGGFAPPDFRFTDVAGRVESRFFTMDIAQQKDGGWMIVELGDGQVAGLPERSEAEQFYRRLKEVAGGLVVDGGNI